ncbi:PREDICTED: proline-rich protein 29 isoform X1 [Crocodylus porosus]|uniref:proline-rich protein 29 isoform X1 n=1 Tax=Crocodylus porosus TaxID=8502 RepID=UPI00093EDEA1|nr:PREDICTED: proline-rich protein 29 isoform X1 [Crocodylus porosus]
MNLGAAEDSCGTWGEIPPGMQIIQQPVPQQPMTIFQQIPGIMSPLAQPIRSGHVWEDLIELMMIQNAQMHQVIMNNLTMSALTSFGLSPAPPTAQMNLLPLQIEEDETDLVFHHHYPPYPSISPIPPWQLPAQPPAQPQKHPSVRHLSLDQHPASVGRNRNELAVPPPPPPSATGTVGADIPPASEYYDFTEGKL